MNMGTAAEDSASLELASSSNANSRPHKNELLTVGGQYGPKTGGGNAQPWQTDRSYQRPRQDEVKLAVANQQYKSYES